VKVCRTVMVKAIALPSASTSAMMTHSLASPNSSRTAIANAAVDAPSVPIRSSVRRSHRSAMAPDSIPRTKKGSIRAAAPTPTMNSDPVSS